MNTRHLPVKLSREEREVRSSQLVEAIADRNAKEFEAKAIADGFKADLKTLVARVDVLHHVLKTNVEYREVEVYEVPRPAAGMVDIHRVDTGDLVDTREMTETERQVVMFPKPAAVGSAAEAVVDAVAGKRRRRAAPGMI